MRWVAYWFSAFLLFPFLLLIVLGCYLGLKSLMNSTVGVILISGSCDRCSRIQINAASEHTHFGTFQIGLVGLCFGTNMLNLGGFCCLFVFMAFDWQ